MTGTAQETPPGRAVIEAVVAALVWSQDDKDWPRLRDLFAPKVHLDMSRVFGEPAVDLTSQALTEMASAVLGGFDCTHHVTSNVEATIEGDRAQCRAHVIAYHHVSVDDGSVDHCTMRGRWELGLRQVDGGWVIEQWAVVRTAPWDGNPNVYALAAARRQGGEGS